MRDIFKSLFVLILASSAFYLGFYMGKENVLSQIPDFQDDSEGKLPEG
jgi:uncharacterized membrane protein